MNDRHVDGGVWSQMIQLCRRRWISGVLTALVVGGVGVFAVFFARPIYRAEARLRLGEPPPSTGVNPTGGVLGLLGRLGGDPFANDLELIESRTIAEQLVMDGALTMRLDAGRGIYRDSLFVLVSTNQETIKGTYRLTWLDSLRLEVRLTDRDSLVGVFEGDEPLEFGGLRIVLRPFAPTLANTFDISTVPFGEAVRITRSELRVERARRDANVIDIQVDSGDPGVALAMVTSTVRRFVELRSDLQERESRATVDSLRRVAAETLADLRAAERLLQRAQEEGRVVDASAQAEGLVRQFSEVSLELARAEAQFAGIDSVLKTVNPEPGPTAWTSLVSVPRFFENETVGELFSTLNVLEQERGELVMRRTEQNRELQVVIQRIRQLDGMLRSLAHGYRDNTAQALLFLRRDYARLDSVLTAIPAIANDVRRTERDVLVLSQIYVLTEQRLRQEELREALFHSNVQTVDPPALRFKPVWPRKKLGIAVTLLMAGGLATFTMVMHDRSDLTVRRGYDVESISSTRILVSAVVGGGVLRLTDDDMALLEDLGDPTRGFTFVHVTPSDQEWVSRVTSPMGELSVGPVVRARVDAATISRGDRQVVLIVCQGRTLIDDVNRAVTLLRASEATVIGAVFLVRRPSALADAWT